MNQILNDGTKCSTEASVRGHCNAAGYSWDLCSCRCHFKMWRQGLVVDLYWLHLVIVLVGITVRPADAVRFCVVLGYLELNVIKHIIWSNVHRMVNHMF